MTIKDRLTRGFFAGFISGIPMNIWSYILHMYNLTELRFVDWTSILLLGHTADPNFLNHAIALSAHLVFTGILGIIFAYLIQFITSTNYYFKGWLFSVSVWFSSYALSLFFEAFNKIKLSPITPTTNFVSATAWGLILAWVLKWLDTSAEARI